MDFTKEDVKRLAELARLALSENEILERQAELARVLEYVGRLAAVDTSGVMETESSEFAASLREDAVFSCDAATRELILANFPDRTGDALRVPAVFEKPKG